MAISKKKKRVEISLNVEVLTALDEVVIEANKQNPSFGFTRSRIIELTLINFFNEGVKQQTKMTKNNKA